MKDTPTNEFLPASSLSVILGLHDRSKDVEARRLTNCQTLLLFRLETGNISESAR